MTARPAFRRKGRAGRRGERRLGFAPALAPPPGVAFANLAQTEAGANSGVSA
jgi:hypothetical protein